ncbi:hypothetical protein JCM1840_001165 [Sporobolomyces johnsonii]
MLSLASPILHTSGRNGLPLSCSASPHKSPAAPTSPSPPPPRPDGSISPEVVYIAQLAGVKTVVKAGGVQAIVPVVHGTESVSKRDKLYGPGNQFVTAAKMSMAMESGAKVAIDVPAGPSEAYQPASSSASPVQASLCTRSNPA